MVLILIQMLVLGITPQLPISIATTDDGLAVLANPSGLGMRRGLEFYYLYNFQHQEFLNNNSFLLSCGPLGFFIEPKPLRYGLALGVKQEQFLGGVRLVRDSIIRWDLGTMVRPWPWFSIGGMWQGFNRSLGRVGIGAGVRPFGSRLTFFAESYFNPVQPFVGFQAEPIPGVEFAGRMKIERTKQVNFAAGVSISLGRIGLGFCGVPSPAELAGVVRISQEFRRSVFPGVKRYLEINLSEPVLDQRPGFSLMGLRRARTTYSLLEVLRKAEEEPSVKGIILKLGNENMSFAQAQEFRSALLKLRQEGKRVWVYAQNLGMVGYYLASGADQIILHPMGDVVIPGVTLRSTFLKGALEKLGLKAEAHRRGRYKSAVEVFTEDSMSTENEEQLQALVDGWYDEFIKATGEGRGLSAEEMESLIGQAFFRAEPAKTTGLIDTFLFEDELDSLVKREFRDARKISEKVLTGKRDFNYNWVEPEKLAVIYITGNIVLGESGTDFLTGEQRAGSKTLSRAIRDAGNAKKVKGILVRVDSPGGDGIAADAIWREVELVKKKKPVVVSMGGLAASGGYYVSCNATRIFALPGTITGSIGVFSLRLITEGLYNKLGIRRRVVKRGEHADALSDFRELTAVEDSILQDQIDWFYEQFISKVARGRNLTLEWVDSVAQGRVWLGRDARQLGLVDSLGGFIEAIEFCREKAGLRKDFEVISYPQPRRGIGAFLGEKIELLLGNILER
ncbi:MAG: signal peptide peptidase SppA [bacterium]